MMQFTEYVELMLARIYEAEQTYGTGRYFSLAELSENLKDAPPRQWIFDAAKVLESRGLINAIFSLGGMCSALLTGEGRLFVEEKRDKSGIIEKYEKTPSQFVVVTGDNNQIQVAGDNTKGGQKASVRQQRSYAFELVEQIRESLKNDQQVAEAERDDLLKDLEALETLLEQKNPNVNALAALLEPMSSITSIASNVTSLIAAIGG